MNDLAKNVTPLRAPKKVLMEVQGLEKTYVQAGESLTIFNNISLELSSGEIVALVGQSGSGKSTLLQQIGLLDKPNAGKIMMQGKEVSNLDDEQRTLLRRHYIGFVYQFHYLQPEFSALENVVIPQLIKGASKKEAHEKAQKLLTDMGLAHRLTHRPARLSGGEQQRVAIARALANDPKILLADEPTGNLDPKTSTEVFEMLIKRTRDAGIGAIIATHNMDLAKKMDRVLEMKDGKLQAL